jgi:hypothetical protein
MAFHPDRNWPRDLLKIFEINHDLTKYVSRYYGAYDTLFHYTFGIGNSFDFYSPPVDALHGIQSILLFIGTPGTKGQGLYSLWRSKMTRRWNSLKAAGM